MIWGVWKNHAGDMKVNGIANPLQGSFLTAPDSLLGFRQWFQVIGHTIRSLGDRGG